MRTRKQRGGYQDDFLTLDQNKLFTAIFNHDINVNNDLLNQDLNFQNREDLTPLMFAVIKGHVGYVEAILNKNPDLTLTDREETASQMAERFGSVEIKRMFNNHLGTKNSEIPRPVSAASTVSTASRVSLTSKPPQKTRGPWRGGKRPGKGRKTRRPHKM